MMADQNEEEKHDIADQIDSDDDEDRTVTESYLSDEENVE